MKAYFNENDYDDDGASEAAELSKKHLVRAYQLQLSGQVEEAIEEYKMSIDALPTAEGWAFLGWAYSFLENYKEAIACCKEGIKVDLEFGNCWNDIGAYLILQQKYDEAKHYLYRALEAQRYATKHFPHYNLGRILERQGKWFEALEEYQEALNIEPNYEMAIHAATRLQALMN